MPGPPSVSPARPSPPPAAGLSSRGGRNGRPPALDVLLAAGLTLAGIVEALLQPAGAGSRTVSALAMVLAAVPLAWRRRAPVLALGAAALAMAVQAPLDGMLVTRMIAPLAVLVVALYSAGRYAEGRREIAGVAIAIPVLVAIRAAFDPTVENAGEVVVTFVAVLIPALTGRWVRGQQLLRRELTEKAALLTRERERAAREAAEQERIRIADDLQLAATGGLQRIAADAARLPARLDASDLAGARTAFSEIAQTARSALGDVRRVLGILRRDEDAAPLEPGGLPLPARRPAMAPPGDPVRAASGRPRIDPRTTDRLVAAVVAVATGIQLAAVVSATQLPVAVLSAAAIAAPLLIRRRFPLAVVAAVLAVSVAQSLLLDLSAYPVGDVVAVVCATYAVGAYASHRAGLAGLALAAAGTAAHAAIFFPHGLAAALLGGVAVPWTIGRIIRGQRELTREFEDRAARADAERAQDARAAVTAERMRVARELHDAVAHNLSVIAIQAGGAEPLVDRDPARAARCAKLIASVAEEALAELGGLLAPLDPSAPAPAASLARVDGRAGRARDGGLPVALRVEGEPAPLPAGVDLAAYRIVQEALANTTKHANAHRAWVVVRYGDRAVEVEVGDDGRGAPAAHTGDAGGHGLLGMRERVALYGGTLDVTEPAGGGFTIRARLPIGAA